MNTSDEKLKKLKQLGLKRQQNCYAGHYPINHPELHNGKYDSEFVSPYSISSCNVDTKIMILLQDWASYNKLRKPFDEQFAKLGHDPKLATNKNLQELLQDVFSLQLKDVFATNVFPFIKGGNMDKKIPRNDIFRAYEEFCYPQIEIIKPKLVVCCGQDAYVASLNYFGKTSNEPLKVGDSFQQNGILFYLQRHPGSKGIGFDYGGIESAKRDWFKMKYDFEQFKNKTI